MADSSMAPESCSCQDRKQLSGFSLPKAGRSSTLASTFSAPISESSRSMRSGSLPRAKSSGYGRKAIFHVRAAGEDAADDAGGAAAAGAAASTAGVEEGADAVVTAGSE